MTDREALHRAICANPDEDTPRLVYADWLQENGEAERAAFVRAQIEVARAEPFSPQARAAAAKADELLKKNRKEWGEPVRYWVEDYRFERGFIGHVTIEVFPFVRNAEMIFNAEPVQSLLLTRHADPTDRFSLQPVFELPQLKRIRRLSFAPRIEFIYEEYEALAASPHLDTLTDLSFRDNPIHPPWLREVLLGEKFPAIAGLDIADNTNLGPSILGALSRSDHRNLRRLDVSRVSFNSDQLRQLLATRCLQEVEELRLGWAGRQGDAGPLFHLDPGWVLPWDRLRVLDLTGQRIGNDGVRAIARTAEAVNLRWLDLADNDLGPEAVRVLVAAKNLKLYHLDVSRNGLTPGYVDVLKARFPEAVVLG